MSQTLEALAQFAGARLIGNGQTQITGVASIKSAGPGDLVFVQEEKNLPQALGSKAGAVVAGEFAAAANAGKALLIAANPRLAFARAAALLYPPKRYPAAIHVTAVVHPSAKVARSASVDAYAIVEANADVGERAHIGAGCWVGEGVRIGEDCDVFPRAAIYAGTRLGRGVVVHAGAVLGSDGFGYVRDEGDKRYHKFPQIGELEIGDYVEIGANCTIDRGALDKTVIGPGTKLDNMVHIGHNCNIGANVVIAAQVGLSGSVEIGESVVMGGQVGIGDHAKIGEGAILGGQCGILPGKKLSGKGVLFWGTPARPLRQYLRELAVLARLARKEQQ